MNLSHLHLGRLEILDDANLDMEDAADALVREVRSTYAKGNAKAGISTASDRFFGGSSTSDAVRKAMADLGLLIDKWASTYRRWAKAGKRDDGTAYSWTSWVDFGKKELLSAIAYQTNVAWDSSILNNAIEAAKTTAAQTAKAVETGIQTAVAVVKSPWTRVLLLGVGGLAALYFLSKVMKSGAAMAKTIKEKE